MSFSDANFLFDEVPSELYGVMLYDIGTKSSGGTTYGNVSIEEQSVPNRCRPILCGVFQNTPLEFSITIGANMERIDNNMPLTLDDRVRIGSWLSGHGGYKYLQVNENLLGTIRYKCIIKDLTPISSGGDVWALVGTVRCDSPFAYRIPESYSYTFTEGSSFIFDNLSNINSFYKPKIIITLPDTGGNFSITNQSNGNDVMQFTSLPAISGVITIDNENCKISSTINSNMYQYFNYHWFKFVKGENALSVSGPCSIEIQCEFPLNIGVF